MPNQKTPVLIDTDANNELDDQHAMAYACFSEDALDVVGVTVNNTPNGDGIQGQYDEAYRILHLCEALDAVPLYKGADGNFEEIRSNIQDAEFDGSEAVDFIIEQAKRERDQTLVLIPIGKLTNIALALAKAPEIQERVRVVWLGSNYPAAGEYNLAADPASVNFVLASEVPFEMVTVRYTEITGSTYVRVSTDEIEQRMPGLGPTVPAIKGRHGNEFTNFGDYSISLFQHQKAGMRPLFDVVAVAVVKNPDWGAKNPIKASRLNELEWDLDGPQGREIHIWEHFHKEAILRDFFEVMTAASN